MARNTRRTKTRTNRAYRSIEDTLQQLSDVKAQLKSAEAKLDGILDELQIREYIATNRHGPGDHTFTIPPRDKPVN